MRCSFNGPTERPSHPPIKQDGRSTPTLECMSGGDRGSDSTHTPPRGRHEVQERNNNPPTNNEETEQTDENFNSFHYWRPPLPDISEELEMLKDQVPLQNQAAGIKEGEKEEMVVEAKEEMASLKPVTSSQIQKVLDCLQPHMDDPDAQGEG